MMIQYHALKTSTGMQVSHTPQTRRHQRTHQPTHASTKRKHAKTSATNLAANTSGITEVQANIRVRRNTDEPSPQMSKLSIKGSPARAKLPRGALAPSKKILGERNRQAMFVTTTNFLDHPSANDESPWIRVLPDPEPS